MSRPGDGGFRPHVSAPGQKGELSADSCKSGARLSRTVRGEMGRSVEKSRCCLFKESRYCQVGRRAQSCCQKLTRTVSFGIAAVKVLRYTGILQGDTDRFRALMANDIGLVAKRFLAPLSPDQGLKLPTAPWFDSSGSRTVVRDRDSISVARASVEMRSFGPHSSLGSSSRIPDEVCSSMFEPREQSADAQGESLDMTAGQGT